MGVLPSAVDVNTPATQNQLMYDQLLFPTDGSDGAEAVTDDVLDIAAAHDATLHVLNVADTAHDSVTRVGDEVIDVFEQEGDTLVE